MKVRHYHQVFNFIHIRVAWRTPRTGSQWSIATPSNSSPTVNVVKRECFQTETNASTMVVPHLIRFASFFLQGSLIEILFKCKSIRFQETEKKRDKIFLVMFWTKHSIWNFQYNINMIVREKKFKRITNSFHQKPGWGNWPRPVWISIKLHRFFRDDDGSWGTETRWQSIAGFRALNQRNYTIEKSRFCFIRRWINYPSIKK